jgi:transcription initiation factor IIE alpha subunit
MLRALATWLAKWKYVFAKETEAGLNEWSARVAERNAKDTRALLVKLSHEAAQFEARIKLVAEMEESGFYLCDNGHEKGGALLPDADGAARKCIECNAPVKYIKRSEMNGQELYESDKDRREAEKLLAQKHQEIADKETEAGQQDATAKYFRQQAESARKLADSIRNL